MFVGKRGDGVKRVRFFTVCVCVCLCVCMSVIIGRDPPGPFTSCVGRGGRKRVQRGNKGQCNYTQERKRKSESVCYREGKTWFLFFLVCVIKRIGNCV